MKSQNQFVAAAVICCAALAMAPLNGAAAPVAPGESLAASAPDDRELSGALGDRAGPHNGRGEAKTIDLLMEMQPRTAGLEFNDRARSQARDLRIRPTGAERREDTPAAGESANVPRSGLFGAGATPTVHTNRPAPAAGEWKPSSGGGLQRAGDAGGGSGRPVDADARWLWLPPALVRFVRDNRELVAAGAAGLLALLWAGSVAVSNARR